MKQKTHHLQQRLSSTILGADDAIFELLAALLAGGHVLIEGAPGIGKTTLVKTLANAISGDFKRIQFTPDLLPSDLVGYSIFRQDKSEFEFAPGPVFSNFLLADEINRTSPRIQSALLECMNEGQVTVDGKTHLLPEMFQVIATQNNRYHTGTFPLPEPQLDRFLISIEMHLPEVEIQSAVLKKHAHDAATAQSPGNEEPVTDIEEVLAWREQVRKLPIADEICHYVVRLCEAVRKERELDGEISNRGSIALMRTAQAIAALNGNDGVFPEDIKKAFIPAISHRVSLAGDDYSTNGGMGGRKQIKGILKKIRESVEVD